jgi:deoxyribonuclease-4
MKYLGAHVSTEGGVDQAPINAQAIGAKAFALFVKPQRQWVAPPLKAGLAEAFKANCASAGIDLAHVLPHASYLINMATPDEAARLRAVDSLVGELRRCAELGLVGLNIHPGSSLKTGTPQEACARVSDSINRALATVPDVEVIVENTAGQGSYLGSRFEELAWIIDGVVDKSRVGVCLDTAHLFGAGFDIADPAGYEKTFKEFSKAVGFDKLRALHLNDTKVAGGSHVDRHACIGDGVLGWETFARIMHDDRFDAIPLVLETPDPDKWAEEIRRLYEL